MMKATFYGQSTVLLTLGDCEVLFDPFITPNELAKHIDVQSIKPKYILLSHAHDDHVADLMLIQENSGAQLIAIVETAAWASKQGIDESKITPMNFGGTVNLDFGTAKMVYALHTNSTPDLTYGGVPAGYLINSHGKKIYFAGDTALTMEMKLLEDEHIDWAILPIGGHFTMDVDDAIKAAKFINCSKVIGVHYDTFPPIKIDKEEAIAKFQEAGLQLHLPAIGASVDL